MGSSGALGSAVYVDQLTEDTAPLTTDIISVEHNPAGPAVDRKSQLGNLPVSPWLIDIDVFMTAIAQTNFDALSVLNTIVYCATKASTGAQNAEINWDVWLAAGTWTLEMMHVTYLDRGIYTAALDGTTVGTIDGYSAGAVVNVRSTITGIVVAASGKKRLRLKLATKNASSSSYAGVIQHVQLRRTA